MLDLEPTVNQKKVYQCRKGAHNVIKECIEKLCERYLLKYKVTRAISSFSPILNDTVDSKITEKRFSTLLKISSWVSVVIAEKAKKRVQNTSSQ